MRRLKRLFMLFCCVLNLEAEKSSWELQVIGGVQNYFQCNCVVFLVQNGFDEAALTASRGAHLSGLGKMFATLALSSLADKYSVIHKACSRPLLVLFATDHGELAELGKVSQTMPLSGPVWLIFLPNHLALETAFLPVHIPFDSELLVARHDADPGPSRVTLTEVYRVATGDSTLRTHAFGQWSEQRGFAGSELAFFARRNNLHGLVLNAVAIQDPPMILLERDGNKSIITGGSTGELWLNAQKRLNFTFVAGPPTSGLWGAELGNGSWDGMIGMVLRGEAHCALNGFVTNYYYARVVKYCLPLENTHFGVYLSELDGRDVSWSNFLSPFTPTLWLTALSTTLAIAALTYTLGHLHHRHCHSDAITASDACFFTFGAVYCNQSHGQSPPALSIRIVFVIVYMLALIVVSSYSAFLTSSFTVIKPRIPFTTLEGLLEDGTYELGFQKRAYVIRYFQDAKRGLLKDIFDRHVSVSTSPLTSAEGLTRVCADHKYAFVAPLAVVRPMKASLGCKIFGFPQEFVKLTTNNGFCPPGSPYQPLFNSYFLRLREFGVSRHVIELYSRSLPRRERDEVDVIILEQVFPIVCMFGGGVAAALLCLFGEHLSRTRYP